MTGGARLYQSSDARLIVQALLAVVAAVACPGMSIVIVASLFGGVVGSLVGAFAAALVVLVGLRLLKGEWPRYWNAYKAVAIASVVSYCLGYGVGLGLGETSIPIMLGLGLLIQILVYANVLELPSGGRVGVGTATLLSLMHLAFGAVIFALAVAIVVAG